MKRIFLIRHAKSNWDNPELRDIDRPLNPRGVVDAPLMADRACWFGKPNEVWTSPARRACRTAELMKSSWLEKIPVKVKDILYHGSASEVLELIRKCDCEFHSIALFFHNPVITNLSNLLTSSMIHHIPTSGIVLIEAKVELWTQIEIGACTLKEFDYPKKQR